MASRKPLFKDVGFQQKEQAMTNPQYRSLKEEAGEVNIILVPHAEGRVKGREGAQGGSTGDGLSLPPSLVRWRVSLPHLIVGYLRDTRRQTF